MKRRNHQVQNGANSGEFSHLPPLKLPSGTLVTMESSNYPKHCWSIGKNGLSVGLAKCRARGSWPVFEIENTAKGTRFAVSNVDDCNGTPYLCLCDSGFSLIASSMEVPALFNMYIDEHLNERMITVRVASDGDRYIRHSNFKLVLSSAAEENEAGGLSTFNGDSLFVLRIVDPQKEGSRSDETTRCSSATESPVVSSLCSLKGITDRPTSRDASTFEGSSSPVKSVPLNVIPDASPLRPGAKATGVEPELRESPVAKVPRVVVDLDEQLDVQADCRQDFSQRDSEFVDLTVSDSENEMITSPKTGAPQIFEEVPQDCSVGEVDNADESLLNSGPSGTSHALKNPDPIPDEFKVCTTTLDSIGSSSENSGSLSSACVLQNVTASATMTAPQTSSIKTYIPAPQILGPDRTSRARELLAAEYRNLYVLVSGRSARAGVLYPLQGAGGMESAWAMDLVGDKHLPKELIDRIESCSTMKQRGGVSQFAPTTPEVTKVIHALRRQVVSKVAKAAVFGVTSRAYAKDCVYLGYCEFIELPGGKDIPPHRDGVNDCDFAAVFAIENSARVTVSGQTFTLNPGDSYCFQPSRQVHSVEKTDDGKPRLVVTLRFFHNPPL